MASGSEPVQVPSCPGDGMPMIATIAGWRCPLCGLAALSSRVDARTRAIAARPAPR
jgi:hypothetical protein